MIEQVYIGLRKFFSRVDSLNYKSSESNFVLDPKELYLTLRVCESRQRNGSGGVGLVSNN